MSLQRNSIDQLIDLDTLHNQDKVDVLLVLDKSKPAAIIEISYFKDSGFTKRSFQNQIVLLSDILTQLNLANKLKLNYPKSPEDLTEYSLIALDRKMIGRLDHAQNNKDAFQRRLNLGRLLGYPDSAITAFSQGRSIDINQLPKSVRDSVELKFLNFRLSENWQEELTYLKERANKIRKVAPRLYSKILEKGQFKDLPGYL